MFNLSETTILTILVSAYFLFVLWYGLRGTHQTHEGKDFLTANQNVGWLFCALSLVSTIIGGSATLGMGTLAQKTGTAAFWCNWAHHSRLAHCAKDSPHESSHAPRGAS